MYKDINASGSVPLVLFVLGIIAAGGLYTLAFLFLLPTFYVLIPNSIFKSFIIWGIVWYAPFTIAVVLVLALIQSGLKRESWEMMQ